MNFPPLFPYDEDRDEALAAISTGIPAMAWTDDPSLGTQFENELRARLVRHGISGLPALVKQLRVEGEQINSPIGQLAGALSVLYDDAGRMPPSPIGQTQFIDPASGRKPV